MYYSFGCPDLDLMGYKSLVELVSDIKKMHGTDDLTEYIKVLIGLFFAWPPQACLVKLNANGKFSGFVYERC